MYLLDTNVVSELRKYKTGKADASVMQWNDTVHINDCYLSVITIMELEMGVLRVARKDVQQGLMLKEWLTNSVLRAFETRILDVDLAVVRICASLHIPDPQPDRDALIAATAKLYGMTLVTRNVEDFLSTKVPLINPWTFGK